MHGIFRSCKKKLDAMIGLYALSGRTIFTTTNLTETLLIETEFQSVKYLLTIHADNKKFFSGAQLHKAKMEDHNIIHNLLNIIIKEAFRQTSLRQIGKQPRFFDVSKAIEVEGSGL